MRAVAIVVACLALLGGVVASVTPADLAEVLCAKYYSPTSPQSDELVQNLYQSGRRPRKSSCAEGALVGQIAKGDYNKILEFYREHHPFLGQFRLNSSGGNVTEAIKIGQFFRKYLITAWAPICPSNGSAVLWRVCKGQGCTCASACALIWFGAIHRHGSVGLHRPFTEDPTFRAMSPTEASAVYRTVLNSVSRYLEEMEVPRPMIDAMAATGSAEIRWVEFDEELERPPSIAEWEKASCGSLTIQENGTYLSLMVRTAEREPLSQQEQILYKLLLERSKKIGLCVHALIANHRDRLSFPNGAEQ